MAIQSKSVNSSEHDWYATRSGLPTYAPLSEHKAAYFSSLGFAGNASIQKPITQMEKEWVNSLAGDYSSNSNGLSDTWREACATNNVTVGRNIEECKFNFFTSIQGNPPLDAYIRSLSGLVGYWPLNETSGSKALDAGSNGLDGDITGATLAQNGKIGRAYSFDGINDLLDIPGDALNLTNNQLTMLILLNVSSKGGDFSNWFHKNYKWGMKWGNSPSGEIFAYVNTGSEVSVASDEVLANDTWQLITLTYDGSLGSNNLKLYVNAALKNQANVTGNLADTAGTSLQINSDTTAMTAVVQHIALFNRALTLSEITTLAKTAEVI